MLVKDFIAQYFEKLEIQKVFGVSGANIEDLYSAISARKKTSIVLAKNEYNASMMAIGSYLSSKKVTAVLTTSGAGVLNTLPILAEGFSSKLPFVLISGIVPQNLEGLGAFQDTSGSGNTFDLTKVLAPCCQSIRKITSATEIPAAINEAFSLANLNKLPVVLLIPKDLFNQECLEDQIIISEIKTTEDIPTGPAEEFLQRVINSKKSPLVILGEQLIHEADLKDVYFFIKNLNASVAVTPTAKGLYDHFDPDFLGLTGVMGHDRVNEFLKETDDVIILGSELDMLSRFSIQKDLTEKNIFIINNDWSGTSNFELQSENKIILKGDINKYISSLSEKFNFHKDFSFPDLTSKKSMLNDQEFSYKNILASIENNLPYNADVFVDAGNSGAFAIHNLKPRGEGIFYVSLGMGGMGNSIGAAIGSCAHSGKKTSVIMGDGSFLMHGLEMHTAIEHELPLTFFIFNNNSHAMCTTREEIFLDGSTETNNFKQSFLGKGFNDIFPGLKSFDVNTLAELTKALESLQTSKGASIISLNIKDTTQPPFRTFIKS
ncbi:MAG: thiamine pyrophosphate-binding protein [Rhizobacter sp.]|nr:thiamine pyrophosphate-binding protein [Bacteriovorax sp.]